MWLHTTTVSRRAMRNAISYGVNMMSRSGGTQRIALPNAGEVS